MTFERIRKAAAWAAWAVFAASFVALLALSATSWWDDDVAVVSLAGELWRTSGFLAVALSLLPYVDRGVRRIVALFVGP